MNWFAARLRASACALSLVLAGCAGLAPQPVVAPATAASPRSYSDNIELAGRLSVRYQGNQKEEALHGNFNWNQTPVLTSVALLSPLGQTMAVIDVTPQGARLAQNGQPVRTAPDVDTLTEQTLGWPLPVAGLREWLQGYAIDAAGRRIVATPQASELTTRDGWQLRYAAWQDDTPTPQNRPKRIDLSRHTAQAGDVSIRIVIDSWQTR
jgi:outer membrane lipoprotein LolB